MQRYRRRVCSRGQHELAALEVEQRRLNSTSGETSRVGDRLMAEARLPRIAMSLVVQVYVDDERCGLVIVSNQIGHEAVDHI